MGLISLSTRHQTSTSILQHSSRVMAKNRKYQSAAIRFGPALKVVLLCALFGGSGVGYVWQKSQIADLGRQIGGREVCLHKLEQQNEQMRKQAAMMRSPMYLDARIKDLNLGLVRPQPSQLWWLNEPSRDAVASNAVRQYVQHGGTTAIP